MKKSDALMGIFDILYKTDNNFQYSTAYEILNYLESLGMKPPVVVENDIDPSNPFLDKAIYEWEPEDV